MHEKIKTFGLRSTGKNAELEAEDACIGIL